jgi:CheY-like chemotaxis protein
MSECARVLVIDDDEIVGKSFDRVLTDKGYNVTKASNGEEGLKDVNSSEDYDVVFTDIVMPGMDGLEVTKQIRERCPWTPVVVITGYGSKESEDRASILGANGFVRKPLTPEIIESVTLKAIKDRVELLKTKTSQELVIEEPRRTAKDFLKGAGLFLASPFIALAYVVVLPVFGVYQFGRLAHEAYRSKKENVSPSATS